MREEGKIGSSLQAQLTIKANQELTTQILKFKDDLRFIFITSSVLVESHEGPLEIKVTPSTHNKCERCWHYASTVGADKAHPSICSRCITNLFGEGELRHHA